MATVYAAVVSVMHLMEQIKQYHIRYPIFLDQQQTQLESLNGLVSFFLDFLEGTYSHGVSKEMDVLESRIADAAYAAEDIIETRVVDDIHFRLGKKIPVNNLSKRLHKMKEYVTNHVKRTSPNHDFSQGLQKIIEEMELIKKEPIEIKNNCRLKDQQPRDPEQRQVFSSSPPSGKDAIIFDEDLNNIMDKLTGQQSYRQVITITGMGGIGKTTLGKNVYDNLLVVQHFDIRGWITISQQYDARELVLCLLIQFGNGDVLNKKKKLGYQNLGEMLHKHLTGRRYLIVMDDIWNVEVWDKLKLFLPDNQNGSRVMVTTRILNVANNIGSSDLYQMKLLDDDESWSLLCKRVFVEENCPPELVNIGKIIASNCKGLPLSIGVIGGLLARFKMIPEIWEHLSQNTNITVSLNDDDRCLKILSLSYSHLPIHLKPCFLYMRVFPEDHEIRVSNLIRLWVAEGFLKPSKGKELEQVAKDYLKDLIDRNLIFACKLGCTGNVKSCKIHDLLRDFCLKEAKKENFLHVEVVHKPKVSQGINSIRRIAIHTKSNGRSTSKGFCYLRSLPFLRSLIGDLDLSLMPLVNLRLLRVCDAVGLKFSKATHHLCNSRYLKFYFEHRVLPSSMSMLWNLQTLIITNGDWRFVAPYEIWKMPQLRHVIVNHLSLLNPSISQMDEQGDFVLDNLQTLSKVIDFQCTEEVVRKIPNIVKLKLEYFEIHEEGLPRFCLNNFRHLKKLQSLHCEFLFNELSATGLHSLHILEFPLSLRKLTLHNVGLQWEDVTSKIGSLPHLEKLILQSCSAGAEWNPVEGQFLCLEFLHIGGIYELVCWTVESVHFPRLERLVIVSTANLKEVPPGVGDISTLNSIELRNCTDPVVDSAMKILEEQQSMGNESLCVLVDGKPAKIDIYDQL